MNVYSNHITPFEHRHNGSDEADIKAMLKYIDVASMEELINETIPESIRMENELDIPATSSEYEFINEFKKLASQNQVFKSYIGLGYHNCITPPVILRNILENPAWYTAYTPYQAEIAQGRLEALINFQTMVSDLTGMELANASLLDEGTAAAEAMSMLYSLRKGKKKKSLVFYVDELVLPQTLDILMTRAEPLGIKIQTGSITNIPFSDPDLYGVLIQYPGADGSVKDIEYILKECGENQVFSCVAADLLSLTLLKSPGEMGADVVVGTTQRFGVPMGYGGPHAAYFATKADFKRMIPGRIIGVSQDKYGNNAYRMALQTREQHIKRERATSNICTAQVLLAVLAGMYAVYHGPSGLKNIARRIHGLAVILENEIQKLGLKQINEFFFDTLKVDVSSLDLTILRETAEEKKINFRYEDNFVFISLDETTSEKDIIDITSVFYETQGKMHSEFSLSQEDLKARIPFSMIRESEFLAHEVFQKYHTEHEMLRYMKDLESKDLSLVHSMISLGSCTMKLNATSEMMPLSWPEFKDIHPFAPENQTAGYQKMFVELEKWLSDITGFAATSLQPNSGAQGEYAGLMVIRDYLQSTGQEERNLVLIPSSAHGTNPASAAMAGMKIAIVKCDEKGNIDVEDLYEKAKQNETTLAALMVTYPSTHGVFEENIKEICEIIHDFGGQVYMDGANMNAQVGLTNPGLIGADVCHLNLHKTFCIPHGGGGPGMGPICVASHLTPYLPSHSLIKKRENQGTKTISAAPWGSASILTISYAYIAMMGGSGLKKATQLAILNANYIKERLKDKFPILYTGKKGRAGHEMIVDCRQFKKVGVEVEDIAKRLMDYGFHAPTVSFPVPGTFMVEPTESETKEELDRFCDALISIRNEISEIENGVYDMEENVLKNAPHTVKEISSDAWNHSYGRAKAAYPLRYLELKKFWPASSRIDNAYGDRNLMCSCIPISEYEESEAEMFGKMDMAVN